MAIQFVSVLSLLIAATTTYAAGIQGGVPSNITAHPYYVSIEDRNGGLICGGALIGKEFVLTAAACLANPNVTKWVVRVGSDVSGSGTLISIEASTNDLAYNSTTHEHDIGLVMLSKPITETSSTHAIKIASPNTKSGTNGMVVGLDAKRHLVEAPVIVISAKDCSSGKYRYKNGDLFDSQVCGLPKSGKVCDIPRGSPLVVNNELVGLVSWGNSCKNKGNPTIYTDVAVLNSWD